ncbi:MAG: hypothetical protein AMXMBFR33_37020 [Candidatus Xenobia bacterium]|jgi:outer membrane protein assembly factor BamB
MLNIASLPSAAALARLDWKAEVGPQPSKAVVAGDEVYVGTQTPDKRSELHRFSAASGRRLSTAHTWTGTLQGSMGSTAVMKGVDGQLMGVDASSGERKWGFHAGLRPTAEGYNGEQAVVATERGLAALSEGGPAGLEVPFSITLPDARCISPGPDGWLVLTGRYSGTGQIVSLDSQGQTRWKAPADTGGPRHAPQMGVEGTVYSTGYNGMLSAFDGKTGELKWQYETGETYNNRPDVGPAGQVVVSTQRGHVALLDSEGRETWKLDTGAQVLGCFVHPDGTVFVQHPESLEALDALTGSTLQKLPIQPADLTQAPDGSLYAMSRNGTLQKIVLE